MNRTTRNLVAGVGAVAAVIVGYELLFLPGIKRPKENDPFTQATYERKVYYYRCQENNSLSWFFSVAAAGTAIATAIRSAYSPLRKGAAMSDEKGGGKRLDGLLLGLAIATVVATALQKSMNPEELAKRYCFGQLQLEKAIFKYEAEPKDQSDVSALIAAYFQAEDVLANGMQSLSKEPSVMDVPPEQPKNRKTDQPEASDSREPPTTMKTRSSDGR